MIFLLPVVNATKEKHFAKLREEVNVENIEIKEDKKTELVSLISLFSVGVIISMLSTLTMIIIYKSFVWYIVLGVLLLAIIALFIAPVLAFKYGKNKKTIRESYITLTCIMKDNHLGIVISFILGLVGSMMLQFLAEVELLVVVFYAISVVIIYLLLISRNNEETSNIFNKPVYHALKRSIKGVPHE